MYKETSTYTVYEVDSNHEIDYVIELGKSVSGIATHDKSIVYKQNATFAFMDKGVYKPIGFVVKEGKLTQTTTSATKWGAFIVPKVGNPYVGLIDPANVSHIKLAIQSTPRLLTNGKYDVSFQYVEGTPEDVKRSTTRSAIGIKPDGTLLLVTTKTNYTLQQLANLVSSLGCQEALNLDGGRSVTKNYHNAPQQGTERPVSAALVVKQLKQKGDDSMTTPLLIIDAGHGGADSGAVGNGLKEKDLTLQISLYQYARFQQLKVPVALTRSKDETLEPSSRTKIVKDSGAKYCISNHINAGGGDGVETIHSIYADGKLAKKLAEAVVAEGQNLRRVFTRALPANAKKDYYFMHRDTGTVDTTILEYGFIDSMKDDVTQLKRDWRLYAEAVVKAFCEFNGLPYSPPVQVDGELENALKVIQSKGAIQTPDYWMKNAVKGGTASGEYAAILIKNVASVITKLDQEICSLKAKD
jgi:N-acetylmuramoyl-L-alanine amidase